MKIIYIDGEKLKDVGEIYDAVRDALPEAELYGNNLDALYDALSVLTEQIGIILVNTDSIRSTPGVKWHGLIRILEDLTDERDNIRALIDPFETDDALIDF
ncbi:MAG: barstar family protein [Clostridia bacterium]|nr:barstar family protein [Clostridia bacterium]MBR3639051.1 barstar family protein [Clostridia bacterium]